MERSCISDLSKMIYGTCQATACWFCHLPLSSDIHAITAIDRTDQWLVRTYCGSRVVLFVQHGLIVAASTSNVECNYQHNVCQCSYSVYDDC